MNIPRNVFTVGTYPGRVFLFFFSLPFSLSSSLFRSWIVFKRYGENEKKRKEKKGEVQRPATPAGIFPRFRAVSDRRTSVVGHAAASRVPLECFRNSILPRDPRRVDLVHRTLSLFTFRDFFVLYSLRFGNNRTDFSG